MKISRPANEAVDNDFLYTEVTQPFHEFFVYNELLSLQVDCQVITLTSYTKMVSQAILYGLEEGSKVEASKVTTDLVNKLEQRFIQARPVKVVQSQELTRNKILMENISEQAIGKGYSVSTNTSSGIEGYNSSYKTSRYHLSRPDLTIFHPKSYSAYLLMTKDDEDDETDRGMRMDFLQAGTTENKLTTGGGGDGLPQLLAGMEKIAGDLSKYHLKTKKKYFDLVWIYGLLIDHGHHVQVGNELYYICEYIIL